MVGSLLQLHDELLLFGAEGSVALSGTVTAATTPDDIVAGGKTIILTLTGDVWVAAGAAFDAVRQDIIDGLNAPADPANGWNAEVRDKQAVTGVVRTSDTIVTITLDAQAGYAVTASEVITATVPASALAEASEDLIAAPTFTVSAAGAAGGAVGLRGRRYWRRPGRRH